MVVRGRRRSNSELAALHDTKRTLNSRGGGRSSVSSVSDVSSVAGSVASKVKYLWSGFFIGCVIYAKGTRNLMQTISLPLTMLSKK